MVRTRPNISFPFAKAMRPLAILVPKPVTPMAPTLIPAPAQATAMGTACLEASYIASITFPNQALKSLRTKRGMSKARIVAQKADLSGLHPRTMAAMRKSKGSPW